MFFPRKKWNSISYCARQARRHHSNCYFLERGGNLVIKKSVVSLRTLGFHTGFRLEKEHWKCIFATMTASKEELIIFSSSFTACPLDNRPFGSLWQWWHSFDLRAGRLSGGRNQFQFGYHRPSYSHRLPVWRKPFRSGKFFMLKFIQHWPTSCQLFFYIILWKKLQGVLSSSSNIKKTLETWKATFLCIKICRFWYQTCKRWSSMCACVGRNGDTRAKLVETHYDKWLRFNLFFSLLSPRLGNSRCIMYPTNNRKSGKKSRERESVAQKSIAGNLNNRLGLSKATTFKMEESWNFPTNFLTSPNTRTKWMQQ